MASIFDWSSTAASNTAVDGININTGCSPANLDNADRSLMAIIRQTFTSALQLFLAGSQALPVANGGTGATETVGTLNNLGALSSAYRDLPTTTKSANFTLADAERAGIYILSTAGATATINPYGTTPITIGAVYMIFNASPSSWTVARGAGVTMFKNGSTGSADATVAAGGVANLIHIAGDTWVINGVGVS